MIAAGNLERERSGGSFVLVTNVCAVAGDPLEPAAIDDPLETREPVTHECYAPSGILPNVGAQRASVNLRNRVRYRRHRQPAQRGPEQRDRREVPTNLIASWRRDGVADHDRVPATESSVEEEIESHAVG